MKNTKNNRNKVYRLKNGRFTRKPANNVVSGRLYEFKGSIVRAGKVIEGRRLVTIHKTLFGFVKDCQLKKVDNSFVETYLLHS
jgi:hypothetical protein